MGQKLYHQTEEGGIVFHSERRPGEVRIPNYVYDLWMPLLGATAVGVYAVYCRLEMAGSVKKMSIQRLALSCRMSTGTLGRINDKLVNCGFIRIRKPVGMQRYMHYTQEITICDPPTTISHELIQKYRPPHGYEALSVWLVQTAAEYAELLPSNSGITTQLCDALPDSNAKIVTLDDCNPLYIVSLPPSAPLPGEDDTVTPGISQQADEPVLEAAVALAPTPAAAAPLPQPSKAPGGGKAAYGPATAELMRVWYEEFCGKPLTEVNIREQNVARGTMRDLLGYDYHGRKILTAKSYTVDEIASCIRALKGAQPRGEAVPGILPALIDQYLDDKEPWPNPKTWIHLRPLHPRPPAWKRKEQAELGELSRRF